MSLAKSISSETEILKAYVTGACFPDTGQTKRYNNNEEIVCPAPGKAPYGQAGNEHRQSQERRKR